MTEKIITDVTANAGKKKFLEFIDALSRYPPMTFERYRDADNNHTNWFPQQYYQDTASMYREWFTLAVLNNRRFIMLVYKRRDPDATKIFTEMINSVDFRNAMNPYYKCFIKKIISRCVKIPIIRIYRYKIIDNDIDVRINYLWDFDISVLLYYYNNIFHNGNINNVSANINICNEISHLARKPKHDIWNLKLDFSEFLYDVGSKKCFYKIKNIAEIHCFINPHYIDNIYAFQILSNSTILFKFFSPFDFFEDVYHREIFIENKVNSAKTISTLLENIVDVLK